MKKLLYLATLTVLLMSCMKEDDVDTSSSTPNIENSFFQRKKSNSVTLTGSEGKFISYETSQIMISNYLKREQKRGNKNPTQGIFFGKEKLLELLEKENTVGLTFYFGMKEGDSEKMSLIIVSSDNKWNDIVTPRNARTSSGTPTNDYLDFGGGCCPPALLDGQLMRE